MRNCLEMKVYRSGEAILTKYYPTGLRGMILDRFLEYVNSDLNQPVGLGPTSLYNDDWKILVGWNYLKNSTF